MLRLLLADVHLATKQSVPSISLVEKRIIQGDLRIEPSHSAHQVPIAIRRFESATITKNFFSVLRNGDLSVQSPFFRDTADRSSSITQF
jgi:hypothetical protein